MVRSIWDDDIVLHFVLVFFFRDFFMMFYDLRLAMFLFGCLFFSVALQRGVGIVCMAIWRWRSS